VRDLLSGAFTSLIVQAVCWYLRYPLSYRDIEELFLERGLRVDHSTLNRWVLAYAPLIERRLRSFRKPHCGSIRVDETYISAIALMRRIPMSGSFAQNRINPQRNGSSELCPSSSNRTT